MTKLILAAAVILAVSMAAVAQPVVQPPGGVPLLKELPADATTVADYYKQNVYDPGGERIGEIADLIVTKDGAVLAAIVSVGGFLGIASKFVAVPFAALQVTQRERRPYLVLDTNRRTLRDAPSFAYNRTTRRWERVEDALP